MQNIRSKGTKPERMILNELRRRRIKFSSYVDSIPGKPDIVFRQKKTIVFIDSDFWHGHPDRFIMPKTNIDYWQEKIFHNKERDKEITERLIDSGWNVIRLWEQDIYDNIDCCLKKIFDLIGFVE